MTMKWTDVTDIAIELSEQYPDIDPLTISFVDLHRWICELDGFDDDPQRSGEKILEAIQAAWIEEMDD
ncbi:MAG: Fe-S cluster assembly protein IscX [Pseudohongiellaceae bacterium]